MILIRKYTKFSVLRVKKEKKRKSFSQNRPPRALPLSLRSGKGYRHKDLDLRATPPASGRSSFHTPRIETGRSSGSIFLNVPHWPSIDESEKKIDLKKYACGRCAVAYEFLE